MMSNMVRTSNASKYGKSDIIIRRKSQKEKTTERCMEHGAGSLPMVKSYCRECRGTTGKVVGGTETHWEIQCDCGQHWKENKISFAQKYIGLDGNAPEFTQREPQVQERSWKDEMPGSQIRQMEDLLKGFNSRNSNNEQSESKVFPMATVVTDNVSEIKEETVENPKASENEETKIKESIMQEKKNENVELSVTEANSQNATVEVEENDLVTFEVAGIRVSFREGIAVTVHRVDGKVHIVIQ